MTSLVDQSSALLSHLRNRFNVGAENLATEALAFILNSYPEAREAFLAHCTRFHEGLPSIGLFKTQDWSAGDEAIPDLIGVNGDGTPLIVEVKFQAALTANQPATYLRRLLDSESGGLLLFLVPEQRLPHLWEQLKTRCRDHGWELTDEAPSFAAASSGNSRIGVTSWSAVLNSLDLALRAVTDQRAFWELRQLRSLCEYEDLQIFEPLNSTDLDRRAGRRIGEYRDLVYEVVESALDRDIVDLKGLARTRTAESLGRWFKLAGWGAQLCVNWTLWATQEHQSPIWLWLSESHMKSFQPLFDSLQPRGLLARDPASGNRPWICIRLPQGADRDTVLQSIVDQVTEVARLLPPAPAFAEVVELPEETSDQVEV